MLIKTYPSQILISSIYFAEYLLFYSKAYHIVASFLTVTFVHNSTYLS